MFPSKSVRWFRKVVLLLAATMTTLTIVNWKLENWRIEEIWQPEEYNASELAYGPDTTGCRLPEMTLENSHLNNFFHDNFKINCTGAGQNWIFLAHGRVFFNKTEMSKFGSVDDVKCTIKQFWRQTDHYNNFGRIVKLYDDFELTSDYFHVECSLGKFNYQNKHAAIAKNVEIFKRLLANKNKAHQWNVYYLGIDSVSRLTFLRKFPKTFHYIESVLGAITLKGHNIVGDGTPQALIPMLTGVTEFELPNVQKGEKGSHFLDVYPFIWKNFSSAGYATLLAEDEPTYDTFTYRLNGFNKSPSDHYSRNFWIEVERKSMFFSPKDNDCLRGQLKVDVHWDQIRQFFEVYPDDKIAKFAFSLTNFGHDDNNRLLPLDHVLLNHLESMKAAGHLDRTILMIFSDHGARFSNVRQTQEGKLEERLPFYSFVLPEAFKLEHPDKVRNLMTNVNRLTTPFDLHPTILGLISAPEPQKKNNRAMNLFQEISPTRTCERAGIEPHWCACLRWLNVGDEDNDVVRSSATEIVRLFNERIAKHQDMCAPLSLGRIRNAYKLMPSRGLMAYFNVRDQAGYVPYFKKNYSAYSVLLYQITFDTMPGENIYDVMVTYDLVNKNTTFDFKTMSVLNRYHAKGYCIREVAPLLEKFCSCKQKQNATAASVPVA